MQGSSNRFPFPGIPSGWYVVATSDELRAGSVLSKRYFGRDLVLFRTASGKICVTDAFCPHMGAHLGRGQVEGEQLRCVFHGFCFDAEGLCVSTPYESRIPERARLERLVVQEKNGLVLAWFDVEGKPPEWQVPEYETDGWLDPICKHYEIPTTPQETSENSVDFGHFTHVHTFQGAEIEGPLETDGPLLTSHYSIVYGFGMIGLPNLTIRPRFKVEVWGLGYSLVHLSIPAFRLDMRLWVLPTPIDEEHVEMRLAASSRHRSKLVARPLRRFVHRAFCREVEEDIPVWSSKAFVERPALAEGEWPVAKYRSWAKQFYPPAPTDRSD